MCYNSVLYMDRYRELEREYFVFNTKNNFLTIPRMESKKMGEEH